MNILQISTILANSSVQKIGLLKTNLENTPADNVRIIKIMRAMPETRPIELRIEAIFSIMTNRFLTCFTEPTPSSLPNSSIPGPDLAYQDAVMETEAFIKQ